MKIRLVSPIEEIALLVINKRKTLTIIKSALIVKRAMKEISHHC